MFYVLRKAWEIYIRIPQELNERKSNSLSKFLKLYLHEVHKQEDPEPVRFSDMKSVANILSGEFLADIQQCCARCKNDDDTDVLVQYLLEGRGWMILDVLTNIGVEGVSCSRELSELLLQLLPLCFKAPMKEDAPLLPGYITDVPSMETCFHHLQPGSSTMHMPLRHSYTAPASLSELPLGGSTVSTGTPLATMPESASHAKGSSSESEEEKNSSKQSRRKSTSSSSGAKNLFRTYGKEFLFKSHVFTNRQLSYDGEEVECSELDDFPVHKTPLEVCIQIIWIVQHLCQSDMSHQVPSKSLPIMVLPQLTQFLSTFQTEKDENTIPEGWKDKDLMLLQRFLVRVIVNLSSLISTHKNGVAILTANGMVSVLLDRAKSLANELEMESADSLCKRKMLLLTFISDVVQGLLLLVHSIFHSLPLNPAFFSHALKLLHDLCDNGGFDLLELAVREYDVMLESPSLPMNLIQTCRRRSSMLMLSVGKVISSLKKAKVDYIHTMKCLKRKHRKCEFSRYLHHHHDILGVSSSLYVSHVFTSSDSYCSQDGQGFIDSEESDQSPCAVAVFADFVLQLYQKMRSKYLQAQVLLCLEDSGICCCMVPDRVLRHLLARVEKHGAPMRNKILTITTRLLLDQCGGATGLLPQYESKLCMCSTDKTQDIKTEDKEEGGIEVTFIETSDSALSSSDASLHESEKQKFYPKWRCLQQFKQLVLGCDRAISSQVMQHLLRLVSQGTNSLKHELFSHVFLPILQAAKQKFLQEPIQMDSTLDANHHLVISDDVVHYCLSGLPLLLQSRTALDLFFNYGSVKLLCQLLQVDCLRRAVLKVFEVLVIVEDKKLLMSSQPSPEDTPFAGSGNFSHLMDDTSSDTRWSHASYASKTSHSTMEEKTTPEASTRDIEVDYNSSLNVIHAFLSVLFATQVNDDLESLGVGESPPKAPPCVGSSTMVPGSPVPTCSTFTRTFSYSLPAMDTAKQLFFTMDIWCTCDTLFIHSTTFQRLFLEHGGLPLVQQLLTKTLMTLDRSVPPGGDLEDSEGQQQLQQTAAMFKNRLSLFESLMSLAMGCCVNEAQTDGMRVDPSELISQVKTLLWENVPDDETSIRSICDALLNAAVSRKAMDDILQTHTFTVMHLRSEEPMDDDDIQSLSEGSSGREHEVRQFELGYEADSECTADDFLRAARRRLNKWPPKAYTSVQHNVILYPEVCHLVVELLIQQQEDYKGLLNNNLLIHVVHRLILLAKEKPQNAVVLYQQGLVELVLSGFQNLLTSNEKLAKVPQMLLLDLFMLLTQHTLSSAQLKLLLRMFHTKHPPLESLLSTLISLSENMRPHPSHILNFPILRRDLSGDDMFVRSIDSDFLAASLRQVSLSMRSGTPQENLHRKSSAKSGSEHDQEYLTLLRQNSTQDALILDSSSTVTSASDGPVRNTKSPRLVAPLQVPLSGMTWPSSKKGFSVSLWMRTECTGSAGGVAGQKRQRRRGKSVGFKDYSSLESLVDLDLGGGSRGHEGGRISSQKHWTEGCLHLLSLGTSDVLFELWTDPALNNLVLRLSNHSHESEDVLTESSISNILTSGQWQHLTITYKETVDNHWTYGSAVLVLEGYISREVNLEYKHPANISSKAENKLYLGHAVHTLGGATGNNSWQLGNVMVFKDAVLSQETCFHLFTMGPNSCTVSQCESLESEPVYMYHITSDLVQHSGLDHAVLTKADTLSLQPLRENLLVVYSPKHATTYNQYGDSMATKKSGLSLTSLLSQKEKVFNGLIQQAKRIPIQLTGEVAPLCNRGLDAAVHELGGIGVFLFLFAKVVESCESSKEQAKALRLLFSLVRNSPQHAKDFLDMSGCAMLSRVLATSGCAVGIDMLKVLLDACLSEAIVKYDSSKKQHYINPANNCIIQDTFILRDLLFDWRVWDKTSVNVWKLGFEAIEVLIDEKHPHMVFNRKQLQRARIVDKLLNICLERIQDGYPSLPLPICESMVRVIQSMLGSPPDINLVVTVCDFLLLIHPAASTFVSHQTTHFYFTSKWAVDVRRKSRRLTTSLPIHSTPVQNKIRANASGYKATENSPEKETTIVFGRERRHSNNGADIKRANSVPDMAKSAKKQLPFRRSSFSSGESTDSSDTPPTISAPFYPALTVTTTSRPSTGSEEVISGPESLVDKSQDDYTLIPSPESTMCKTDDSEAVVIDSPRGVPHGADRKGGWSTDGSEVVVTTDGVCEGGGNMADVSQDDLTERSIEVSLGDIMNANAESPRSLVFATDHFQHIRESGDNVSPVDSLHPHTTLETVIEQSVSDHEKTNTQQSEQPTSSASSTIKRAPLNVHTRGSTASITASQLSSLSPSSKSSEEWELYPSSASMNSIPVSLSSTKDSVDDIEEGELGLIEIATGLLNLLAGVVIALPENTLKRIMGIVLKPEFLVVLVHHNSAGIRTAVIRLLDVYFHRSSPDQSEPFLKIHGFHLLASQLHQHTSSRELLEACFTILLGQPHLLEDPIHPNLLVEMSPVQQYAVVPILSLLEGTIQDTALCHNSLTQLLCLFESVPDMAVVMLDNGLVETLCNMVAVINRMPVRSTDVVGTDERQVVIGDLEQFFSFIAVRAFGLSGVSFYQQFEDTMTLLHFLEHKETLRHGANSEAVEVVRDIQFKVLQMVLDYVTFKMDSDSIMQPRRTVSSTMRRRRLHRRSTRELPSPARKSQQTSWFVQPPPIHVIPEETGQESTKDQTNKPSLHATYKVPSTSRASSTQGFGWSHSTPRGRGLQMTQHEMLDRLKKVLAMTVDLIIFSERLRLPAVVLEQRRERPGEDGQETVFEKKFIRYMLEYLLHGIVIGMERFQKGTLSALLWQAKDALRFQFSRLLCYCLSPEEDLEQRFYALHMIMDEHRCKEVLRMVLPINMAGQKLAYYLHELRVNHGGSMSQRLSLEADGLIHLLQACGFTPLDLETPLSAEQSATIEEDKHNWASELRKAQQSWLSKRDNSLHRVLHRLDSLSKQMSANAMEVTQAVVMAQNMERKKFIEHVKMSMTNGLQVKKSWNHLIQQLTHERAVWFCPESYPRSWQLDPTEGPCRVRRRLQRCHINIDSRFLMPDYQENTLQEQREPPLSFLFDDDHQTSDSAALIYRLHTNEKIQLTYRCTSVTPSSETPGEILVGENNVYFVGDEAIMDANYTQVLLGNKDLLSMTWPHEDIKELHKRRYQLRDNALEIFLTNGKTCLLAFDSTKERDQLYRHLDSMDLPHLIKAENLTAIQQMWHDGLMTNFEYVTHLNKMAGRSFNDLMQYPVFPFILCNYQSEALDLEEPSSYRNLVKPMAVQHKEREKKFLDNYKWLEMEYLRMAERDTGELKAEPYHYGSHYSNSGTVLHFLVRLPPFTRMFLSYQDQNFDLPDRTFHSLQTTWRLASYESTTDVKELIPEFFFLPEFLCNNEGYNFGLRQNGNRVWDTQLPPWCEGNPRLFVLVHRQALESALTTHSLPQWIDLVYGFKQTGKAAKDSINVFHPATYFGIEVDNIADPVRRNAIKTMIKTYGQTPKQLFRIPHPARLQSLDTPSGGSGNKLHQLFSGDRSSSGGSNKTYSKDDTEKIDSVPSPLAGVKGLRWGQYVGSPDCLPPALTWSQSHNALVASVVALPTGEVFGLGLNSCLLVKYSEEKGVTAMNTKDVMWAGIVSWNSSDNIIRIKNRKNEPAVNFLCWSSDERVTSCASVPDCRLLFFGGTSGVITILHTKFNTSKKCDLQVCAPPMCLYGHSGAVTALCVSKPYSVLVSSSQDGTCIIWDLNRLCYVRTISDHEHAVHAVCVSDTLGDIATVSHTESGGSCLMLHTINAKFVSSLFSPDKIHCVTFSTAPEGRSVNIIAGGLSTGNIRLWSSWDLQHVRDIVTENFTLPVISLTFSTDSQRLYGANTAGTVAMWENTKPSQTKHRQPNFIPFL